ncbi:hypothetical protein K440DRAFT_679189 [Wilcoxina mikolae CBS 423.85]|nr:hypothetical protein K440DRAFT_679189 [Wilcoxina mikolae CBS 423.85]
MVMLIIIIILGKYAESEPAIQRSDTEVPEITGEKLAIADQGTHTEATERPQRKYGIIYTAVKNALYTVAGIHFATCFANLLAGLVIFETLSFDQRFLIAASQQLATLQLIASGLLFAKSLTLPYIILCAAQAGLSVAFTIMDIKHDHKPFEKQCLTSHWPTLFPGKPTLRPDIQIMFSAILWLLALVYFIVQYWRGSIKLSKTSSQSWDIHQKPLEDLALSRWLAPKNNNLKSCLLMLLLVAVTFGVWIVMVYFTVMIYAAATHLKIDKSDQELRSFGQILALCTVGASVWQLAWFSATCGKELKEKKKTVISPGNSGSEQAVPGGG